MFCISLLLILPGSIYAIGLGQPHYECGEHGRFEYCIDGVPGCIVGCHCHPGYYFDTETKICEPNAKLVQEYKRLFSGYSPTRVPEILLPENTPELEPTPTPAVAVNQQVESMAKDSDDLGDWLYNQFFKTIEGSVMNKTESDSEKPNRRSGNLEIPTAQTGKTEKSKKRSKSKKKSDLRRKLLRISENDSIFDSSEESSEDSSNSDSSPESSNSNESNTSNKSKNKSGSNSDKHCHRKIFAVNRKPKPPLPSFIFLPQMQPPFFPPMGMPPPLPMYPMIPVPPMAPIPFPPPDNCSTTTEKSEKTEKSETEKTEPTTEKNVPNNSSDTNNTNPDGLRTRMGRRGHARNEFLKHLQHSMQDPEMSNIMKKFYKLRKTAHELPIEDLETPMSNKVFSFVDGNEQIPHPSPGAGGDVDFKYLAQLIHKINNKTGHNGPPQKHPMFPPFYSHGGPPPEDTNLIAPINKPPDNDVTRRFGQLNDIQQNAPTGIKTRRVLESPNDSYYSNLGREIATLIRKIDATGGEPQLDIEIERSVTPTPSQFLNENSYAPRSYWERSVRSLFNQYGSYADEPSRPYEYNLFNLERKVETVATTTQPLSLHELENYVFTIDNNRPKIQQPTRPPELVHLDMKNENFNVDLLSRRFGQRYLEQPKSENVNPQKFNTNNYERQNINLLQNNDRFKNNETEFYEQNGYEKQNDKQLSESQNSKLDTENEYPHLRSGQQYYNRRLMLPLPNFTPKKEDKYRENIKESVYSDTFTPNNLRGALLRNSRVYHRLPKGLSYNINDIPIKNTQFNNGLYFNMLNVPVFTAKKNNTLYNKGEDENPPRYMSVKMNDVSQQEQVLNKTVVPWLSPKIANLLVSQNDIYRINQQNQLRQQPNNIDVHHHTPLHIQIGFAPRNSRYKIPRIKESIRQEILPLKIKMPSRRYETESQYFQHSLLAPFFN